MKEIFADKQKSIHVDEELADTLFFILRFAQMNDMDLYKVLISKMKKNGEKYSVDKIKGKNLKYNEL